MVLLLDTVCTIKLISNNKILTALFDHSYLTWLALKFAIRYDTLFNVGKYT